MAFLGRARGHSVSVEARPALGENLAYHFPRCSPSWKKFRAELLRPERRNHSLPPRRGKTSCPAELADSRR
jgi:hypothetical protein